MSTVKWLTVIYEYLGRRVFEFKINNIPYNVYLIYIIMRLYLSIKFLFMYFNV